MEAALRAIQSPRRRAILRLVWDGELGAGDIAARFDISWPAISQHLQVLREAGLVRQRREGNRRLYAAERASMGPIAAVLEEMWRDDLSRLKELAEAEARELGRRDDTDPNHEQENR